MDKRRKPPKNTFKISARFLIYCLFIVAVAFVVTSVFLGFTVYNLIYPSNNSKGSSSSTISTISTIENETSSQSTSSASEPKIGFVPNVKLLTNSGRFLTFDYPEDSTIKVESYKPNDKFENIEDVKYISIKSENYEIIFAKKKFDSPIQSFVSNYFEYSQNAGSSESCKIVINTSNDKKTDELKCVDNINSFPSTISTPGFSYNPKVNLIVFAHSSTAKLAKGSYAYFGSGSSKREIVIYENFPENPYGNIMIKGMPDSWKNSAYFEFRCNKVNDPIAAKDCIEVFGMFIENFEFKN
jgi:hypothetical protein